MPGHQQLFGIDLRLPAKKGIGGVGLADVVGQGDRAGVAGEGAAAGLAAEVLVEPQGHDAHRGQHARDQLQGVRFQARGGVVAVPVGRTAARQQQRGGQVLPGPVRGDVECPVGGGAADGERDLTAGRGDLR